MAKTGKKEMIEKLKESEEHYRIFASYQQVVSELRMFYAKDVHVKQIIQKALDLIIEKFGYYMAWYAELIEEEKIIAPKLWAGKYEKYLDGLKLEYEDDIEDAKCAVSIAILTKKPFGYADLEHDKDFEKWRAFALQYGYRSNQAIPLLIDGKCESAFLIYSDRPIAFSEKVIEYLKGVVNELAAIIKNITERKEAEEALQESEEKFRALFDHIPTMAFVIDKDHRLIAHNWAFAEKMGDQTDRNTSDLLGVSESTKEFWHGVEKQVIESGHPTWYMEVVESNKRGRSFIECRK